MSDRLRTYLPLIYIAEIEVRRVLGEIQTLGQERQNGKFFFKGEDTEANMLDVCVRSLGETRSNDDLDHYPFPF